VKEAVGGRRIGGVAADSNRVEVHRGSGDERNLKGMTEMRFGMMRVMVGAEEEGDVALKGSIEKGFVAAITRAAI
jgi:hypothetical protein